MRRELPPVHADIPNLAPMVDVVMVILIFFMLGTTFALSEGILPTKLPKQVGPGGGAVVQVIPAIRIALLDDPGPLGCRILVMERELTENSFNALAGLLASKRELGADPMARVLIAAAPSVPYQRVISTMDACLRAGFVNIQFSIGGKAAPSTTNHDDR